MQEENTGSAGDTSSAEDTVPAEEGRPQTRRRRAASRAAGPPEGDDGADARTQTDQSAAENALPDPGGADEPPAKPARGRKTAATKAAKAPAKKAAAKAPAKKAAAKKPAAKKADAAKASADPSAPPVPDVSAPEVAATDAPEVSSTEPVAASTEPAPAAAPRKRAPRKRRSTTTEQAAAATDAADSAGADPQASIDAVGHSTSEQDRSPSEASTSDRAAAAAAARAAVLFQPPPAFDATPLFAAPAPVTAPSARDTADTDDDTAEAVDTSRADDADTSRTDDGDESDDGEGDGDGDGTRRRRRRRGGRGRRRRTDGSGDGDESMDDDSSRPASGTPAAEADTSGDRSETPGDRSDTSGDRSGTSDDDTDASDDTDGDGEGSSRRRRRRRRRKSESDGEEGRTDDPPNTVVKVRDSRDVDDEVTSVKGSTRLEAKKQRRREGREAGRKRPPILSESEFLARREAVDRVMAVRQSGDLTQIAVLEDDVLVEHYVSRASQQSLIGNVYLGRVQNVLPAMEAAFIDIGRGRNAVLYAGEVDWTGMGKGDGQKRIEDVLKSGQSVLVQVTKDPIGHKGARLTSQVSLPGRYVVYVPGGSMNGISRKLPDTERSRLKKILKQVVPEDAGVIVRTAAEGASEDELTNDVSRLQAEWEAIQKKTSGSAPALLHGEPDLAIKVVRDLFNEDFTKLVVSGDRVWDTIDEYVTHVASSLRDRVERWTGSGDVFAAYRIDEQITKAMDRKVWLPSGGSLIIERTEAMTVVDVNTGKFTGSGGNLEETVTRNNLEAAEELVRQLRLRDIGGIIVVDFIDMVLEANRDLVLRRMVECLGRDRTKHQVAEVTSLGLVQMTRKRIGTGLLEAFSEPCPHCKGRGLLVHAHPVESGSPDSSGSGDQSGSSVAGGSGGGRSGRPERRGRKRKNEPAEKAAEPVSPKLEAAATPGEASPADLIPVSADHDTGESAPAAGADEAREPAPDKSGADKSGADTTGADTTGTEEAPRRRTRRRAQRPAGRPETDSSAADGSSAGSGEPVTTLA